MTELITRAQADAAFGIGLPVLGLLVALALFAWRRDRRWALAGGGPPVLAGAMWWVYNALTDRLGLDSAWNLALNWSLFLGVGVAAGLLWRRIAAPPGGGAAERTQEEAIEPPRSE